MKLHVKVTLLVILLILGTASLSVIFVSQTMHEATVEKLEKQAVLIGATMAEHITHSVINREKVAVREALELFKGRMEDAVYVYIVDFGGQVFGHTFEPGLPRVFLEHKPAERITTGGIKRYSIRGEKILDVYYPLIPGMRAHLHIGMRERDPFADIMILRIFNVAAVIILLGSLLAILLSRRITRPLSNLANSLRAFGKGKSEKEIEYLGGAQEVAELTDSFNKMIVDKKRTEEELTKSEQEKTAIIEALNAASESISYQDTNMRILWANAAAGESVGAISKQLVGRYCYEIWYHSSEPCVGCPAEKALKTGQPHEVEMTDPGGRIWLHRGAPVRSTKGDMVGVIATTMDITERKRAEEELKKYTNDLEEARNNLEQKVQERTRELKEAHESLVRKERLAVLGQLSSGVGHELRNPLGVIKNACYFLNMKMETIQDEAVKDNITIMNREINTANKIITDLLDFARIKEPMRQDTDINQLVTETLSKSQIPDNITVSSNFTEDMATVSIDPIQVGQIFLNLIENAVHAIGGSGNLKISTRVTDGTTEVTFADDGCGIPKENLDKIIEPLFTTKAKGIGLGLSVSKSLAKANGASVLVESEEGKGSRFVVRFEKEEV